MNGGQSSFTRGQDIRVEKNKSRNMSEWRKFVLYGFTERVTTFHAFGTMTGCVEEVDTYIYIYKGFFSPRTP